MRINSNIYPIKPAINILTKKLIQLGKSIKFFTTEKTTHTIANDTQDLNSVFQNDALCPQGAQESRVVAHLPR